MVLWRKRFCLLPGPIALAEGVANEQEADMASWCEKASWGFNLVPILQSWGMMNCRIQG